MLSCKKRKVWEDSLFISLKFSTHGLYYTLRNLKWINSLRRAIWVRKFDLCFLGSYHFLWGRGTICLRGAKIFWGTLRWATFLEILEIFWWSRRWARNFYVGIGGPNSFRVPKGGAKIFQVPNVRQRKLTIACHRQTAPPPVKNGNSLSLQVIYT